jgi:thymidylate kinase
VFLCGSTANEGEVWSFFRLAIYLAIDSETLRHRLATRTSNDFGRSDYERDMVLGWHRVAEDDYRRYGATVVDGTRPLSEVVDEVLRIAVAPSP